jgi:hypothetical protein
MEFLKAVEADLRSLSGSELARKKHPAVKEAAERGILKLRFLRSEYASKITVEEVPSRTLFQSQDLISPFLLACNHSDAGSKLVTLSLASVQRLIAFDAVAPSDAPHVMRVLLIQVGVVAFLPFHFIKICALTAWCL